MTNDDPLLIPELEAKVQTYQHIDKIRELLRVFASELLARGETHDRSKLAPEESRVFAEYTPKLKTSTYMSEEYKSFLAGMKPALDHHYANNRHHPEFFEFLVAWRPVRGFEGVYEVGSNGALRSVDREVAREGSQGSLTKKGQFLSPQVTPKGYLRIQLQDGEKWKNAMVHRLVAEAFVENPDGKPEVNHKNGIKWDNHPENLEWVTSSENQVHAYDTGLKKPAAKYVVTCEELDLTTIGCEKMAAAVRECGYERVTAAGIWNAVHRDGTHFDLHFTATLLKEHTYSGVSGMNLVDLLEMWIDWYASSMRHADGDMGKSIDLNEKRFGLDPQLVAIFKNTLRDFNEGKLSVNKPPPANP